MKSLHTIKVFIYLQRPIAGSETFQQTGWCCAMGSISVGVRVARKGYAQGDNIPFHVELTNHSRIKARDPRVALVQVHGEIIKHKLLSKFVLGCGSRAGVMFSYYDTDINVSCGKNHNQENLKIIPLPNNGMVG